MEGHASCPQCGETLSYTYKYHPGVRYLPDGSGEPPEEIFDLDFGCKCELTETEEESICEEARRAWDNYDD